METSSKLIHEKFRSPGELWAGDLDSRARRRGYIFPGAADRGEYSGFLSRRPGL